MVKTKIKVYGYHLDMYGHVNNARYLEFLESARWQLIEEKMELSELEILEITFVVVNININYRKPAFLSQVLEIHTSLAKISKTSAKVHQKIYLENTDTIIADADVTFVILDNQTKKVIAIEGKARKILDDINK